jgi:hypothetical protein
VVKVLFSTRMAGRVKDMKDLSNLKIIEMKDKYFIGRSMQQ